MTRKNRYTHCMLMFKCPCGAHPRRIRIFVNNYYQLEIGWKCRTCGEEVTHSIPFENLTQIASTLGGFPLKKAVKFTDEDVHYLHEMKVCLPEEM